jgi:predicted small metal-binding protein
MTMTYTCRDVGVDCDWKTSAASADTLMAKVGEHAAAVHPTITLTPELQSAVRKAFKDA